MSFGVGLLVLTAPNLQSASVFKTVLPALAKRLDRLLYVQIFPGALTLLPTPPDNADIISRSSHILTKVYSHSIAFPRLDVRVLLGGLKPNLTTMTTKHQIEVVFFDSTSTDDFINGFLDRFNDNDPPKIQKLDSFDVDATYEEGPVVKARPTDKLYNGVVVGGTFDRIHCGHKILLGEALLRCRANLTVGVTDGDAMLKDKVLKDLILPCSARIKDIKEFLKDCDPSLNEYNVVSIFDPFGPAAVDETLELIVASADTQAACVKLNRIRSGEKSMRELDVHVIQMATTSDLVDSEQQGLEVVSSTASRMRMLGKQLVPPSRRWIRTSGPYLVGLTGSSASGKTTIANHLQSLGAGIVNCDLLAHRVYLPGTPAFARVVEMFGPDVVDADSGNVDRKKLGALVFGVENVDKMHALEAIVWPELWNLVESSVRRSWADEGKEVVVLDAAVLLAAGWETLVHQVWVCIVDEDEAVKRIVDRDGKSLEEARKRLESQKNSNAEFVGKANVVFCSNWKSSFTLKQVNEAWNRLQQEYIS